MTLEFGTGDVYLGGERDDKACVAASGGAGGGYTREETAANGHVQAQ